jgi:hypothetical protein
MIVSRFTSLSILVALVSASCTISCSHRTHDEVRVETASTKSAAPGPLVVHEWGTFTSMQGANGASLDGLQHETESLPAFVHSRFPNGSTPSPFHAYGDTSLGVPAQHVNSKMETPVMYFYSSTPRHVDVHVDFEGGVMTQWYPRATTLPAFADDPNAPNAALDVAGIPRSSLDWSIALTPLDRPMPTIPDVSSDDPWSFARDVQAASVTTTDGGATNESERYLFYRGLGRLDLPVRVEVATKDIVVVHDVSEETIPAAFVLDVDSYGRGRFISLGALAGRSSKAHVWSNESKPREDEAALVADLSKEMSAALVAQGLFADEANAMVKTWSKTWFAAEGTRVLYLEPRALIDRVLPLRIDPTPDALVRVIVGRNEFLTVEACDEVKQALKDRLSTNVAVQTIANARLARLGRFLEPAVRLVGSSTNDPDVRKSAEAVLKTMS